MLKIGNFNLKSPYILAPMAGVSQMPFRKLALALGAGLAPTELISAKGLFFANARTKSYLAYDAQIEHPFCVQLFGGEAKTMAIAAEKAVSMGAQILDINMGCPVKKVTKTNAGSALLCDILRAQEIVRAMKLAVGEYTPITAKIRSGWDQDNLNYLDIGKALEDAGISAIALHARTRAQGYSGQADWQQIALLKKNLSIPVIGNGDVQNLADAKKMFEKTNCDGVMIGRAALGNPWIFLDLKNNSPYKIPIDERLKVVKKHFFEHIELCKQVAVESKRAFTIESAIKSFRSHLIWYSKGLSQAAIFRQEVMTAEDYYKLLDLLNNFFGQANTSNITEINSDDGINYAQAFG